MPLQEFLVWISSYGYAAIFVLLMLGIVGLPVPDETLLTLTGYLIFSGTLHFIPAFLCALLGTMSGITISYLIGRVGGARFIHRFGGKLHIRQASVDRVHLWFSRWGHWTLTIGYFIPGIRHVIAVVAGSSGLEYRAFALFAYAGALFWAGLFICAGYFLGNSWQAFPEAMTTIAFWILGAVIVGGGGYWVIRALRKPKRDG